MKTYVSIPVGVCYTAILLNRSGSKGYVHQIVVTSNESEVRATGLNYNNIDTVGKVSWQIIFVSKDPFSLKRTRYQSSSWAPGDNACSSVQDASINNHTYKGVTYYFYAYSFTTFDSYDSWTSDICSLDSVSDYTQILTTDEAIERTFGPDASDKDNVQIPVQWMRSDGKTLEDTFEIEIVAEGEDTTPSEPEADPYDGAYDFEYNGSYYVFNRALVPDVHYSNGTVWQQSMDVTSPPYTVAQAVTMGMIIQVAHSGSGHTGGEF